VRVDRHAAAAGDEARDALARQRAAALPEAHEDVLDPRDLHAALALPAHEPLEGALAALAAALDLRLGQDAREDLVWGPPAVADALEQRVLVALLELACDPRERAVLAQLGEVELVAGEIALEDLPADGDRALALLRLHPGADAVLRPRGLDQLQPVLRR